MGKGKRSFGDIEGMLGGIASALPTQRVPALSVVPQAAPPVAVTASVPKPAPAQGERVIKQTFELREAQRVQLDNLARALGMTTKSFILKALQAQGLDVLESDLIDGRKRPRS